MFETVEAAHIPIPASLTPNGEKMWSFMELRLHIPWFHVVYSQSNGNSEFIQMRFLTRVDQLVEFVRDADIRLRELALVSPSRLNGSGVWKLEPLHEVWRDIDPTTGQAVTIYVLSDGTRYFDPPLGSPETHRQGVELVLRIWD